MLAFQSEIVIFFFRMGKPITHHPRLLMIKQDAFVIGIGKWIHSWRCHVVRIQPPTSTKTMKSWSRTESRLLCVYVPEKSVCAQRVATCLTTNSRSILSLYNNSNNNNKSQTWVPVEMSPTWCYWGDESRRMIKAIRRLIYRFIPWLYSIHYPSHQCMYINIGTPPPFPVGPPKTLHSTYIKDTNAHVERRRRLGSI